MIRTILCPTDFSKSSSHVLNMACDLARVRKAKLITLHVVPDVVLEHVEGLSELPPDEVRERLWQAIRPDHEEERDLVVEHKLLAGNPAENILEVAQAEHCDLIILGRHKHRSAWARWLLGGVAEKVIQQAPCSLLVINDEEET